MALASLKARVAKLEARSAKAPKVIGVIASRFQPKVEMVGNVAYLRPALTEDEFADLARKQQAALLATLSEMADELGHEVATTVDSGQSHNVKPDGFVFDYGDEEFVVIAGEAHPVKKRKSRNGT